jgi:hypothetical protein
LHIMEKFFTPYNPGELPSAMGKLSGEWAVWSIKDSNRSCRREDVLY